MPDCAATKHFLSLSENSSASFSIIDHPSQCTGNFWSTKLCTHFPTDRQRLLQHVARFFALALIEKAARLHFEGLCFKAASTKLASQSHCPCEIVLHGLEVTKFIGGEHAHRLSKQFSAWLPNERCRPGGRITILPSLLRLV